ncbi:protein kinase domain-containing protein [Spirulina sp. 06S082]|uniref:protein kinase domain-containing protein n=1 Tax=Spirulina sp. 06S082 TaxID=3110248 RepID=UPI002B21C2F0|nr:protein kinase [Spirulina sp. 06S082]MEA5472109.1 protein kinase [Spirulina sp. 06S082]
MPVQIVLRVLEGSLKGQEFVFDRRTTCLIGRSFECQIQLSSQEELNTISRYHCLLDINPPEIRIQDFGSLNGTYVNGKKIGQRPDRLRGGGKLTNLPEYELRDGDKIGIGDTIVGVNVEVSSLGDSQDLSGDSIGYRALPPQDETRLLFGGYGNLKLIEQNEFNKVYLAFDRANGDWVILKTLQPKTLKRRAIAAFLEAMEQIKTLDHANIVRLRNYGYHDGRFFFIWNYGEEGNVTQLLDKRGGRLSIDEALPIIFDILTGLEYAHNSEVPQGTQGDDMVTGLVHGDIKPGNILLGRSDRTLTAKLGDYGLLRAFDRAGLSQKTFNKRDATMLGFLPRQQLIDFNYDRPDADIWAVAATLYAMLTGKYPRRFGKKDPLLVVLRSDAIPIRRREPMLPEPLAKAIDFALQDQPTIYFKTAGEFRQALEAAI